MEDIKKQIMAFAASNAHSAIVHAREVLEKDEQTMQVCEAYAKANGLETDGAVAAYASLLIMIEAVKEINKSAQQ